MARRERQRKDIGEQSSCRNRALPKNRHLHMSYARPPRRTPDSDAVQGSVNWRSEKPSLKVSRRTKHLQSLRQQRGNNLPKSRGSPLRDSCKAQLPPPPSYLLGEPSLMFRHKLRRQKNEEIPNRKGAKASPGAVERRYCNQAMPSPGACRRRSQLHGLPV